MFTAAVAQLLLSSTPQDVERRVLALSARLSEALLAREPRIDLRQHLPMAIGLEENLHDRLGGRVGLHPEYEHHLREHEILHREEHHEPIHHHL